MPNATPAKHLFYLDPIFMEDYSSSVVDPTLKLLDHCKICPPPSTVPPSSSPLTFFDLLWLTCPSVQHLLFYNFPHSTTHFTQQVLPLLKHSLSLTLRRFHFLAGNLTWPSHSNHPTLHYAEPDSVPLLVAESTRDFHHLVADYPRHSDLFYPLVPLLRPSSDTAFPILALQITIFPNNGFCFGFTVNHGIADGSTVLQFLTHWASIYKSKANENEDENYSSLAEPFYDRSVIKDPDGLEKIYLEDLKQFRGALKSLYNHLQVPPVNKDIKGGGNVVRETFILTRAHVQRLSHWLVKLLEERKQPQFYTSTFVFANAYALVCLLKAREISCYNYNNCEKKKKKKKKRVQVGFATGCRTRLKYPIPKAYFGNCIGVCWSRGMEIEEMVNGEDGLGFMLAAEAIGSAIAELEKGVLRGAEEWVKKSLEDDEETEKVMIAGTLKLNFYGLDFGWGSARKSEVISNEKKGGISLNESRDGDGGVEIGLALPEDEIAVFSSLFVSGLKALE